MLKILLRRLADELQPTLERHQIVLDLPEVPVIVEGDALRLEHRTRKAALLYARFWAEASGESAPDLWSWWSAMARW